MPASGPADDHPRHGYAKAPPRQGIRDRGSRADLPHGSWTAGQSCRRTGLARISGGGPAGAERRVVSAGGRRLSRDPRAAADAFVGSPVVASRRRALPRGGGSPDRNPARRRSRLRALRSSVPARAIETRSEPWRRGRVARGFRPAGQKRGVTRRWLPSRRLARRSRGLVLGGIWLRWRTWVRAQELDGLLARGADPMDSDELSLRVGQLGSARSRARLACALRGAVELADRQPEPFGMPRSQIRRAEIRASRELLLELAERVDSRGPVGVEGLALTSLLIGDRASPLYDGDARRSLAAAAFTALVALEPATRRPTPSTARARGAGGWSVGTGWVSGPMPRTVPGRHARWA